MTDPPKKSRLAFIDIARGIAVLLMIVWHTADCWLSPDIREQNEVGPMVWLRFFGGNAAPLFLFLAGVGGAIKLAADEKRGVPRGLRARALAGRGIELVTFGYLLSWQMWLIDRSGFRDSLFIPCIVLGAIMGICGLSLSRSLNKSQPKSLPVMAYSFGYIGSITLAWIIVNPKARLVAHHLLHVDVLHCIGASLIALACLEWLPFDVVRKPLWLVTIAITAALLTTPLGKLLPGFIPLPIAGYFSRWDFSSARGQMAAFALFPWMAHVLLGAAWTVFLHKREGKSLYLWAWALFGVGIAILTSERLFIAHLWINPWPILTPITRIAYRLALNWVFLAIAFLISQKKNPVQQICTTLGQASLLIYWVHLEIAYGVMSKPLHRQLNMTNWLIGCITLVALMIGLVYGVRMVRKYAV